MSSISIQRIVFEPCSIGLDQFRLGSLQGSLSKKIKHYAAGCLLIPPVINSIILLVIELFFPQFLRDGQIAQVVQLAPLHKNISVTPKTILQTPKKHIIPPAKTIDDLKDNTLNKIFSYLDVYDLGHVAQVSKKFNHVQANVQVWRDWLGKYSIPVAKDENPHGKAVKLLKRLKVDPSNKSLTLIRKPKNLDWPEAVKEALEIFPFPAWVMQPSAQSNIFDFYFKNHLAQVVENKDINSNNVFSNRLLDANKMMTDHQFIKLKLE